MRVPALISAVLHILILVIMYTGLPLFTDPKTFEPPAVINVEIVDVAEITNLPKPAPEPKKVEPDAKQEVKPAPAPRPAPTPPPAPTPKPEPAPAPKPEPAPTPAPEPAPAPKAEAEPAPKVEPAPAPKPVPKPVVKPAPTPAPKQEPKPEPKPAPKIEPKPDPKPKEPAFDLNQMKALLDKKKQEQSAQSPSDSDIKKPDSGEKVPNSSTKASDQSLPLTISELDALKQQVQKCWNVPTGAVDAENLAITLEVRLNRDGSLMEQPRVVNRLTSDFHRIAAESAKRAVLLCAPYKLPAEKYERWREITMNFDPKEMFGQ